MTGRGRPRKSAAETAGKPAKAKGRNAAAPQREKAEDKLCAAAKNLATTTKTDSITAKTADKKEKTPGYATGASAPGKKANAVGDKKPPEKTVTKPAVEIGRKHDKKIKNVEIQAAIDVSTIPEVKPQRQRQNPEKAQEPGKGNEDHKILKKVLDDVKIKAREISSASQVVNDIITKIVKYLKNKSEYFKDLQEPLRTGSYYEKLKISNPDEFDIMMPMPVDRVNVTAFGTQGAFYSVGLKRGNNKLKHFQENEVLSASKMLDAFRNDIKICIGSLKEWSLKRKKPGCPAVTLETKIDSHVISLDVVLCLFNKSSWPDFTMTGMTIERWLGSKVRRDYRWSGYYLVPKFEGKKDTEIDGVLNKDVWRISFSHVEKAILCNHGSQKTCCESDGERCCRKDCLKLLKYLLNLLKKKHPKIKKICSYHAKTTLLHACCSKTQDSDWRASDLSQCFQRLLETFEGHLERGELPNFFIPGQNLLAQVPHEHRREIASSIRLERENGYPIFK